MTPTRPEMSSPNSRRAWQSRHPRHRPWRSTAPPRGLGPRSARATWRAGPHRTARPGRSRNRRASAAGAAPARLAVHDADVHADQTRVIPRPPRVCACMRRSGPASAVRLLAAQRSLSFHSRNRNSTRDRQSCSGEFRGPSRKGGHSRHCSERTGRAPQAIWVVYAVMGTLLAAYILSLLVRSPTDSWPWVDGWGVCVYELILVGMLFARGFSGRPGRAVPLVLGAAVLAWALGDLVLTWETWGGATAPDPVARRRVLRRVSTRWPTWRSCSCFARRSSDSSPATWLDGAIAGLGAAAVCAAFAFHASSGALGGDGSHARRGHRPDLPDR